jgi:hypothetical protein
MVVHCNGYKDFQLLEMSIVKKEESLNAEIAIRTL